MRTPQALFFFLLEMVFWGTNVFFGLKCGDPGSECGDPGSECGDPGSECGDPGGRGRKDANRRS